jgi:hypothetical protein
VERTAERTVKKQSEMDAFHGRKEETPDASNAEVSSVSVDGAGGGTRTHTVSPPADFESATSTIPSHRHILSRNSQNSHRREQGENSLQKPYFIVTGKP